jgi:hypothetical protein
MGLLKNSQWEVVDAASPAGADNGVWLLEMG